MDIDTKVTELRELCAIQGRTGTIDQGDYMVGLYNGMLLALSILTGEEYRPLSTDKHPMWSWAKRKMRFLLARNHAVIASP
jgi:hypothetical protein